MNRGYCWESWLRWSCLSWKRGHFSYLQFRQVPHSLQCIWLTTLYQLLVKQSSGTSCWEEGREGTWVNGACVPALTGKSGEGLLSQLREGLQALHLETFKVGSCLRKYVPDLALLCRAQSLLCTWRWSFRRFNHKTRMPTLPFSGQMWQLCGPEHMAVTCCKGVGSPVW